MNILTFDIEDWFHLLELPATSELALWGNFEKRIEANTDRLLLLMDETGVKSTCFVLGWIAEQFPSVVKKLADAGHELGIHSYDHSLVYKQSPHVFEEHLKRSCNLVSEISGCPVTMYRAPGFSITENAFWAFESLIKYGITADASVFPGFHAHGGISSFPCDQPCKIMTQGGTLYEFPLNTASLFGKRLAFSGGGHFRVMPYFFLRYLTKRSNYVMAYFHPRDFDPFQKLLPGLSLFRIFKSYYGLRGSYDKLKQWLQDFHFITMGTAIKRIDWTHAQVIKV